MVPAILPHIRPVLATRDGADTGKVAVKVAVKLSVKDMIRDAAGRETGRPDRGAGQAPGAPSDSTDS
ncbi:hypothetical protein [Streptomyces sp. NRRL S-1813]|uniref:hypothetical protein n=1 Tax=Streptomyces sp. NRRL S-1813 TaxID=1463888 RepID=UPI0004C8C9A4|nr:hypothetical protein [Streptomyces sp. NRRL S-1813]